MADNYLNLPIFEVDDDTLEEEMEIFRKSHPNSLVLRTSDEQLDMWYKTKGDELNGKL